MRHAPTLAAALVAATFVAGCTREPSAASDDPAETAVATATVTRQDLTTSDEYAGLLGYADSVALVAGRDGIVTWMPEEGTVVARGGILAEIDGAATRLLLGDRPAWRRMAVGEADGADIWQLNDNLAALGYAERDALPVARFDGRTRDAVSRWQRDLWMRRTGAVELGDVAFLPSEVRVGTVEAEPGTWVGAGQTLASATSTAQVVTVDLDAARRASLSEGSPVVVLLPDRTRVDATVSSVGRNVSAPVGADDPSTVKVEIQAAGLVGDLDAAPVVVIVERVIAQDALTVPVGALVAPAAGGYAVERVTAAGTELITVEPGRFAAGLVEITGEIAEGDSVVVPS